MYAGTIDRIGRFPGDSAETVLEIKTGGPEKWHCWQTGSQEEMWLAQDGQRRHRVVVELRDDGDYRIHPHWNPGDGAEFVDLLLAYRIGRRRGYFEPIPNAEEYDP